MKKLRLLAVIPSLALAGFILTGCVANYSNQSSPASPLAVEDTAYKVAYYSLDNGQVITCLTSGGGRTATLACFDGSSDQTDITPISETKYAVSYLEMGQGVEVVCLNAGSGRSRVHSCVPYED